MNSHEEIDLEQPTLKLWTYAEAVKSLPYVRTVLKSLRDHAITTNHYGLQLQRLKAKPGRPTRSEIVRETDLQRDAQREYDELINDADELEGLGVACLDPFQGEVAFPFLYNEQVAWFHHALFDHPRELSWRLDSDSLTTRRPIVSRIREQISQKGN